MGSFLFSPLMGKIPPNPIDDQGICVLYVAYLCVLDCEFPWFCASSARAKMTRGQPWSKWPKVRGMHSLIFTPKHENFSDFSKSENRIGVIKAKKTTKHPWKSRKSLHHFVRMRKEIRAEWRPEKHTEAESTGPEFRLC